MPVQFPSSMEVTPAGVPIPLQPLQETSFMPAWNKDKAETTAWTVNGRIADLRAIYSGAYLSRNVDAQQDYTNYTRTAGGFYYTCVGGGGSNFGNPGPAICYSPVAGWHDYSETTHQSHEFRLSTPADRRVRGREPRDRQLHRDGNQLRRPPRDVYGVQESGEPHLAHDAGHDALLHVLAGLSAGRVQPGDRRTDSDLGRCG